MSAAPPYEEQQLLLRIAQSDEKAFHAVYKLYFPKVNAMALHYLPDAFRAQDMVQEVFGRIWQHRQSLGAIKSFEAWTITVTRNLLINERYTVKTVCKAVADTVFVCRKILSRSGGDFLLYAGKSIK